MKRVITMALVALIGAVPMATVLTFTDDIQAPRTVELALLRAEDPQAPVRSDEIQAPRSQDLF